MAYCDGRKLSEVEVELGQGKLECLNGVVQGPWRSRQQWWCMKRVPPVFLARPSKKLASCEATQVEQLDPELAAF